MLLMTGLCWPEIMLSISREALDTQPFRGTFFAVHSELQILLLKYGA